MKFLLLIFFCCFLQMAIAQTDNDKIKASIETFFSGMRKNDTAQIRSVTDSSCFLYSVMQTKDGKTILDKEAFDGFLQQVIQLKGQSIDEQITSYSIQTDGALGVAWTPYRFYLNGQFYHCGVNVFTMIKRGDQWKIMGITDTRRRNGCD